MYRKPAKHWKIREFIWYGKQIAKHYFGFYFRTDKETRTLVPYDAEYYDISIYIINIKYNQNDSYMQQIKMIVHSPTPYTLSYNIPKFIYDKIVYCQDNWDDGESDIKSDNEPRVYMPYPETHVTTSIPHIGFTAFAHTPDMKKYFTLFNMVKYYEN